MTSPLTLYSQRRGYQGNQRYNVSNGQIFTETTVQALTGLDQQRHFWAPKRPRDELNHQIRDSVQSLEVLATESVLGQIRHLSMQMLEHVPWAVGRKIWEAAEERGQPGFEMWKLFAACYPLEPEFGYCRHSDNVPLASLSEYVKCINSPALHWLTCLTLSHVAWDRAQMIDLSLLHNLAALDICGTPSFNRMINDGVVRSWGRRASETRAFQKLRVLLIRNQPDVTAASLRYLNELPSLVLYGVHECNISVLDERQARECGWTSEDKHGIAQNLKRDIELSYAWDMPIRYCLEETASLKTSAQACARSGMIDTSLTSERYAIKKPLLNFKIGQTTSDVLYSAPLMFFRRMDRESFSPASKDATKCKTEQIETPKPQRDSTSKKFKLRANRNLDMTDLLGMDGKGGGLQEQRLKSRSH